MLYKKLLFIGISKSQPQVLKLYPHQQTAFTQGLVWHDDKLYESTGLIGHSSIRQLILDQEFPHCITELPEHWGEGIACHGDEIFQLTWKSQLAIVYRLEDLTKLREIAVQGEGWGLSAFNSGFVMTNGTNKLVFVDRQLREQRQVSVNIKGRPLNWLNDLTYAKGSLYINRLSDHCIYQVDPNLGKVERIIDCQKLVEQVNPLDKEDVLNGIAYVEQEDHFIITGKRWPTLFVVNF